jgi:transketolase
MMPAVSESSTDVTSDLSTRSINTLRFLAVDAVQKANSGHPGMPMGAAAMAYTAWHRHLKIDPDVPDWPDRDRFILSAGHGSMLLYGLLHLAGFPLSLDDIKDFRQHESLTPGHPEVGHTIGVETTTGPLGQGFANGVGMALAEKYLSARFNGPGFDVINHSTIAIVSDGDLMEGISHEAGSLAGHLGLGKLIYLYDDNGITIDGKTDLAFTDNTAGRFESYGWQVLIVDDGNDVNAIDVAMSTAKAERSRPSLICVRTHIGFGSPNKQDTSSAHGSPLGEEEIRLTKEGLGWDTSPSFIVPDDVVVHMSEIGKRGRGARERWQEMMDRYQVEYPDMYAQWQLFTADQVNVNWDDVLPRFEAGSTVATRSASGTTINALSPSVPNLIGGSADLAGSNNTYIDGPGDFQADHPEGGNLHFGIREHAMGSICNGMALHGALRPYCATFLVFSDYMRPAIRLSALMGVPVIYLFTHDSIGLGEDGPTHQPIEQLMALRAIPNVTLIRPCDGNETAEAWKVALTHTSGPVILALSRQKLPSLDRDRFAPAAGLARGGYVIFEPDGNPDLIIIATGSEVSLAISAVAELQSRGIATRVVSMPSWELFEAQPKTYRDSVLSPDITARISVEAGVTFGWERYTGLSGKRIGVDRFGASAPASVLFKLLGFSIKRIVTEALEMLND